METPVFTRLYQGGANRTSALALEVIKRQPKQVDSGRIRPEWGEQAPGYIYIAYILSPMAQRCWELSRDFLLLGVLTFTAIVGMLWGPIAGHLSDRIGRKRMYIIAATFISGAFWLRLISRCSIRERPC